MEQMKVWIEVLQLASRLNLKYLHMFIFLLFLPHFCSPGAITLNVVWIKREFDAYKLSRSITHLSSTVSQLFEPQMQKIAVFTYHSPHFCFPWRRPCDYHVTCCMNGKTFQCLPNPSQHVPIYLQYFPSYTMLKLMRKSKNRYFYHIFVPLGTPLGQSR